MSIFLKRVSTFARSPQGRRLFAEAKKVAKDPRTRDQIEQARQRLTKRPPR